MNSTLSYHVDFDIGHDVFADVAFVEDQFATDPIIAVYPAHAFEQPDEEELHTSFEQAISGRVLAMSKQLSRISEPLVNSGVVRTVKREHGRLTKAFLSRVWKQSMLYVGLAVMFLLVGFDLMGVMMLYRH